MSHIIIKVREFKPSLIFNVVVFDIYFDTKNKILLKARSYNVLPYNSLVNKQIFIILIQT